MIAGSPAERVGSVDPYDVVPYEARPLAITHPMRLATAALRSGFRCAPPASCRMLDLGCADATNLLPLALAYPNSEFVGVDRSANQIGAARADVAALGLKNLKLVHADVTDLGDDLGRFDYIVAHGLFSWVSDGAREHILRRFSTSLSERGVGYLSYNAQPGWGARGAVRDSLLLHTASTADPRDKIAEARAHIGTLLSVIGERGDRDPFAAQLAQILEPLASRSDSYLLHEYLSEHNRAFAFGEIVHSLSAHGLSVLADLLRATSTFTAHEALEGALRRARLPPAEVDAAVDLVTCRQFRANLICREADRRSPPGERGLEPWLPGCEIALAGGPEASSQAASSSRATPGRGAPKRTGVGSSPHSVTWLRAALAVLADVWPGSIGIEALLERTSVPAAARGSALRDLLRSCDLGHLELRSHPLAMVARPGLRPVVSPLTRLDAGRGRRVTNQLHRAVTLGPEIAAVATLLDGTRDLPAVETTLWGRELAGDHAPTAGAAVKLLAANALLLA